MFFLTDIRDTEGYIIIIQKALKILGIKILYAHCDYERGLINALKNFQKEFKIVPCYFHFT